MNEAEFLTKLAELENEFNEKKTNLIIECGLSQRKYNNGDIITSDVGTTIKVDTVKVYRGLEKYPMPVYHGVELTKALEPKKNGARGAIYGNDKVTLIKAYTNGLK